MTGNFGALELVVLEHRVMRSLKQVMGMLSEMQPSLRQKVIDRARPARDRKRPIGPKAR